MHIHTYMYTYIYVSMDVSVYATHMYTHFACMSTQVQCFYIQLHGSLIKAVWVVPEFCSVLFGCLKSEASSGRCSRTKGKQARSLPYPTERSLSLSCKSYAWGACILWVDIRRLKFVRDFWGA